MRSSSRRRFLAVSLFVALAGLLALAGQNRFGRAAGRVAVPAAQPAAPAVTFCNNAGITINTSASSPTAATPYPSTVAVSGLTGTVTKVTVTLTNLNHPFPDDVDILLVGPTGAQALIFSDVGGSTCANCPVTLTLDDAAAGILPNSNLPTALASGSFQPANYSSSPADSFPTVTLDPMLGSALSVFNGTAPNGTWSLYVVDDGTANAGTLGGWCLDITAGSGPCAIPPPANVTQAKDANFCGAVVTYSAPATSGACGIVTCTPPSGSYFPLGTTAVNCAEESPGTATATFNVMVTGSCSAGQVCNNSPITITDSGGVANAAAPYPSTINISGVAQPISKVTVTLANFYHSFPDKVDILLVGPQGQKALIWSDVGGGLANGISSSHPVTVTLDDLAAQPLPDTAALSTGTFQPLNDNGGDADTFPMPAPAPDSNSALSVFNGTDANGTWSLYVVSDGGAGSDTGAVASGWCLNIAQPNSPPTITPAGVTRQAGSLTANSTIANVGDAEDAENTLAVTINGGAMATVNGVTVSNLAVSAAGVVTADVATICGATTAMFTMRVTDSGTLFSEGTLTVTVNPNTPPTLSYNNPAAITAGGGATVNPATGPGDNGTIVSLIVQSPGTFTGTVMLNNLTGVVTLGNAAPIGAHTVTIHATDNCGLMTDASFMVQVICPTISLNPATLPGTPVNVPYSQTLTATPAGTYTFAITSGLLPAGLTLNPDGTFSGAPTQSGTFNFRVTATALGSCSAFRDYVLLVGCAPITLAPASLPGGTIGTAYSQMVTASPAGTYGYAVSSGALPPGLTLNAANGQITGSPTTNGSYSFTITATAGACTGSQNYSVSISCPAISFTTASPLPAGSAGVAYSQTLNVTPAGSYTFSLTSGGLPGGLVLNPATGVISGTASAAASATFTVQALAASGCAATQSYTLAVNCPAITLTPATLPGGTVGTAYTQTIAGAPAGGGYTYAVTSGSLPAGLNLNPATGVLSGTPSTAASFTFTITATGFGGCTGSQSYTVVIGGGGCPAITLPASLPNGNVGQLYNAAATASPAGLYSYTITSGSVPPGVTLFGANGLLFGFPTAVGSYTFTITATQGACSGSRSYTVLIGAGMASSLTVFSDFDGDGKSDLSVFRGSNGNWMVANSGDGQLQTTPWGASYAPYDDVTVSGDYDGDGSTDLAVFRCGGEHAGYWFIKRSRDGGVSSHFWGLPTDIPVPGDYDGDGKTDVAVWRGSAGAWYILRSTDGGVTGIFWGSASAGDVPVPGDYDGDGKTDVAVFRRSTGFWYIRRSSDGVTISAEWGVGTDVPVPGDYDGDNRTDIAVWRASEGIWHIVESSSAMTRTASLGTAAQGDLPVVADYDGDGKADAALWRASTGTWIVKRSSDGLEISRAHGQSGDVPIMARRN